MTISGEAVSKRGRTAEFLLLFFVVPGACVLFPPTRLAIPLLLALLGVCVVILKRDGGFRPRAILGFPSDRRELARALFIFAAAAARASCFWRGVWLRTGFCGCP